MQTFLCYGLHVTFFSVKTLMITSVHWGWGGMGGGKHNLIAENYVYLADILRV